MNSAFKINHATQSQRRGEGTRLLILPRNGEGHREFLQHKLFQDLPAALKAGDVLVVNDAATLPSSLMGLHFGGGEPSAVEVRLMQSLNADAKSISHWRAVVYGPGDWSTVTEKRPEPPPLKEGDAFQFSSGLNATILKVERGISSRLVGMKFLETNSRLWSEFYSRARPIQYSYLSAPLEIYDQQTIFSGPPVAIEPPSASFAFTWQLMAKLESRGIEVLSVTHATGISNTGVPSIDAQLPFPERSFVSAEVRSKISAAKKAGRRIIAAGTGVVRALEYADTFMNHQESFINDLKIHGDYKLKVVDGLLTGFHEPGGSHLDMLSVLVDQKKLERAYVEAGDLGYLWHEYGDLCLIA